MDAGAQWRQKLKAQERRNEGSSRVPFPVPEERVLELDMVMHHLPWF